MSGFEAELDKLTTEELAYYAVKADEQDAARAVVERFRQHPAASRLLRHYYLNLPEAREEMASDIRVAAQKQGVFLFVLRTTSHRYFYLCSNDQAVYLGEADKGIRDEAVLRFFGYSSGDEFVEHMPDGYKDLPPVGLEKDGAPPSSCVACGVPVGELHILGCPVEPCPWCGAQLSRCNCRFEQLGVDSIEDDSLLDRFEELLDAQGRIAFQAEQNPSYPTAGSDPPPGENSDGQ